MKEYDFLGKFKTYSDLTIYFQGSRPPIPRIYAPAEIEVLTQRIQSSNTPECVQAET